MVHNLKLFPSPGHTLDVTVVPHYRMADVDTLEREAKKLASFLFQATPATFLSALEQELEDLVK